jgi:hypothetical protein
VNTVKRRAVARLDDRAAAALLCGAVGLFVFNVVLGPIAIGLGVVAARRGPTGRLDRGAALLGIGLGVADLVVFAVLVAGKIHGGTFSWNVTG